MQFSILISFAQVSLQDAVIAVLLLESSTSSSASLVHVTNPLHTTFPANPVAEYRTTANRVLESLGLSELWPDEARRLEQVTKKLLKRGAVEDEEQNAFLEETDIPDYAKVIFVLCKLQTLMLFHLT